MNIRFASLLVPVVCSASFAAEASSRWQIKANFGLTFVNSTATTQSVNFLASAESAHKDVDSIHFDTGIFQNRQTPVGGGAFTTSANYWFVGGRYDRNLSPKSTYYFSTRFRRDSPNELDLRTQYGLGYSHIVHGDDAWNWAISFGASYLTERYTTGAAGRSETGVELGSRYRRRMSKKIDVTSNISIIPRVSDINDYVLQSVLQLGYSLDENFKLAFSDVLDYTSKPIAGAIKQNSTLFFGLEYKTKL